MFGDEVMLTLVEAAGRWWPLVLFMGYLASLDKTTRAKRVQQLLRTRALSALAFLNAAETSGVLSSCLTGLGLWDPRNLWQIPREELFDPVTEGDGEESAQLAIQIQEAFGSIVSYLPGGWYVNTEPDVVAWRRDPSKVALVAFLYALVFCGMKWALEHRRAGGVNSGYEVDMSALMRVVSASAALA